MEDCCRQSETEGGREICPACGAKGKGVSTLTLKQMVRPEFLEEVSKPGFLFCQTASCDVVYFHPEGEQLRKKDVRVQVGVKEREDPVALCYCFGFTEEMVREEIRATGRCTIP